MALLAILHSWNNVGKERQEDYHISAVYGPFLIEMNYSGNLFPTFCNFFGVGGEASKLNKERNTVVHSAITKGVSMNCFKSSLKKILGVHNLVVCGSTNLYKPIAMLAVQFNKINYYEQIDIAVETTSRAFWLESLCVCCANERGVKMIHDW